MLEFGVQKQHFPDNKLQKFSILSIYKIMKKYITSRLGLHVFLPLYSALMPFVLFRGPPINK